jgi:hypothetical protein
MVCMFRSISIEDKSSPYYSCCSIFGGRPLTEFKFIIPVPHSQSGAVPISSLLGVGQLGFWEFGKGGTIGWRVGQIGSVYKQPERREDDSCHSWRAPSKWKGSTKRSKRGNSKGSKGKLKRGQRNHAMYICSCNVCVKNNWVLNMLSTCTYSNSLNECRHVYNNNPNECHF